jgi:RHS repeat-associated protein
MNDKQIVNTKIPAPWIGLGWVRHLLFILMLLGLAPAASAAGNGASLDGAVAVNYSGLTFNRATNTFDSVATLTNVSDQAINHVLSLAITRISSGSVSLANPNGLTPVGQPYVRVPLANGTFKPGEKIKAVVLKFRNPALESFTFSHSVGYEPLTITAVKSSVASNATNDYPTGSFVRLSPLTNRSPQDYNAMLRIWSTKMGYDSGGLVMSGVALDQYRWDTSGLKPAADYRVQVSLTDKFGQTAIHESLSIKLSYDPPSPRKLVDRFDLATPGPGSLLALRRVYRLDSDSQGSMGTGWAHNFNVSLHRISDALIRVVNTDGTGSFFKADANGTYKAAGGDHRTLTKQNDGTYSIAGKNGGIYLFAANGILDSIQDRRGNRLTLKYDDKNQLTEVSDTVGQSLRFGYDAKRRMVSAADPLGRTVVYAYDAQGRLAAVTDIAGLTTRYEYGLDDRLVAIIEPGGHRISFSVDAQGRLTRIRDESASTQLDYAYVTDQPMMKVVDGAGNTTTTLHDESGRVTQITDPLGRQTNYAYDPDGNLLSHKDPKGQESRFIYDGKGNLLTATDPLGHVTAYSYESVANQLASLTDAAGHTTFFNHDANANLVATTHSDGSVERATYDVDGNLESLTDRMGRTIQLRRDARGLLTNKIYPDGTALQFTYDSAGSMTHATGPEGTTAFTYDGASRLLQVVSPQGHTVRYSYDTAGRRAQLLYPDGTRHDYRYDSAGRLIRIEAGGVLLVSYGYDGLGRMAQRMLKNGVVSAFSYDSLGQLVEVSHSKGPAPAFARYRYTYDELGNRTSMTNVAGVVTSYGYDGLGQLTAVAKNGTPSESYQYDPAGNRMLSTDASGTISYLTNELNQYSQAGSAQFEYDANGNLTRRVGPEGTTTYSYDFDNRLIRVQTPSAQVAYNYDALGRRVVKTSSSGAVTYLHDGPQVIADADASGRIHATYAYGLGIDEVLAMRRSSKSHYYSQDGLGSVTGLTDEAGSLVEAYDYDAYGQPGTSSVLGNRYLFTGREYEPEAGIYFYRTRFYDPRRGRFLSADSIGIGGGVNLYTYSSNDPVNRVDPFGTISDEVKRNLVDTTVDLAIGALVATTFGPVVGVGFAYLHNQYGTSYYDAYRDYSTYTQNSSYNPNSSFPSYQYNNNYNNYYNTNNPTYNYRRGDPTFIEVSEKLGTPRRVLAQAHGLVARLSVPYENALVRANVPVFGLAYGKDFKEYRVEYGEGSNPRDWKVIAQSSQAKVRDDSLKERTSSGDGTIHGNLATWDTGLSNYTYGDEFTADHPINLNGVYTVRLVVANRNGQSVEDRVTLEVGSVIPTIYGGTVPSADGRAVLSVPEHGIREPFRVFSLKPAENVPLADLERAFGPVFEARPAGERFTKDVTLTIAQPEGSEGKPLGIYAWRQGRWEYCPTSVDQANRQLQAELRELPKGPAYFAVLERADAAEDEPISPVAAAAFRNRYAASLPPFDLHRASLAPVLLPRGEWAIFNSFEDGIGEWSNRDGDVGASLALTRKGCRDGYCLQLINQEGGGNFASTITKREFDASKYPVVRFDYRIPNDTRINLQVRMDGRWYDIQMTSAPKQYKRLNLERIGQVDGLVADGQWHSAEFNLYDALRNHPALTNHDRFVVEEMAFADWESVGYMKLVYGKNPKGARFWIDNFMVGRPHPLPDGFQVALNDAKVGLGLDKSVAGKAASVTPTVSGDPGDASFLLEDFDKYARGGVLDSSWGSLLQPSSSAQVTPSISRDEQRGNTLRVSYALPKSGDFAGIYRKLSEFDLGRFKSVSFWIKADKPRSVVWVAIKDQSGKESKVLVGSFLEKGITRDWQKVSIPLRAFADVRDLARLHTLTFMFIGSESGESGAIAIDEIRFDPDASTLFISNCGQPWESKSIIKQSGDAARNNGGSDRGTSIWGVGNFLFYTSMARIDAANDQHGCLIHFSGIESSRAGEGWAGWGVNLHSANVADYQVLSFKIKRVNRVERPNIYLSDKKSKAFVELDRYAQASLDWQTVEIPLRDFKEVDLHNLTGLSMVFEWETMDGSLYVRDLAFRPEGAQRR